MCECVAERREKTTWGENMRATEGNWKIASITHSTRTAEAERDDFQVGATWKINERQESSSHIYGATGWWWRHSLSLSLAPACKFSITHVQRVCSSIIQQQQITHSLVMLMARTRTFLLWRTYIYIKYTPTTIHILSCRERRFNQFFNTRQQHRGWALWIRTVVFADAPYFI